MRHLLYLSHMPGLRSLRVLAITFVAVLATYSGVWMYYIRAQESANARGFEHAFRPSELAAVVTAVRPAGAAHDAGLRAGDRIVAIDDQPLDSYDRLLDTFGRTAPGRALSLRVLGSHGARTITFPITSNRDKAQAGPGAGSRSSRVLATVITGYPLVFLAVASVVLLQRPADRDAWVMALAFGGLIASAPLLMIEPQMPSGLRRFMVPVWVFLESTMPAALYYFFAVFPAASAVDRRVPWLKWVLGGVAVTAGGITAGVCLAFGDSEGLWWVAEHVPAGTAAWILRGRVPASVASSEAVILAEVEPSALPTDARLVNFADAQYNAAVSDLERALQERRNDLNPRTVEILERNLTLIDAAIAQARQALEEDPGNTYLNRHLVESRRRKLELLRRATTISEGD